MTVVGQALFLFLFTLVGTLVDDFLTKRKSDVRPER
jgi:hypothetical protein